ncbi:MAG: helix-turn-helix domain-containing protein [Eubacterium sp.]|nr:helix-turn-helix domain-containing protein [Eubacterium sp.]
MYIGIKNVKNYLSDFPCVLTNSDGTHALTGWSVLHEDTKVLSPHLLYVCSSLAALSYSIDYTRLHVLCILGDDDAYDADSEALSAVHSILFVTCHNPEIIYHKLDEFFTIQCGVGYFGHSLLEFLDYEKGLQPAVDYSFRIFENPVFVFDANFNLIAAPYDQLKQQNYSDDVVLNKQLNDHHFEMINRQNNIHERVRRSHVPIQSFNEELGYDQLYCSISHTKDLGHIVVSALNKPFTPIDIQFLMTFRIYIEMQLNKDSFVKSSRGYNYEYFIRDLLDHKIAANQRDLSQMKYIKNDFKGNLYCMVVELARSVETINAIHIRNILESRIPSLKTIIYNGQIICLITMPKNQFLSKDHHEIIHKICLDNGLYIGLSNCFYDIFKVEEYYNQSLRAIELGSPKNKNHPGLFLYEDNYLEHLLNAFSLNESSKTFCHPKMQLLLDYDQSHNSQMAYTLYMYLTHERNLAATSEAMNMHRTSLVYRFKKINSLIGEDFNDYRERMYLILSYEMSKNE